MPIPAPSPVLGGASPFYDEPIVRQRGAVTTDPYSAESTGIDWSAPLEIQFLGAFAPSGSTEPVELGRDSVVTKPAVYAPFGVDVLAGDRIVVRSRVWEVDGDPAQWRMPGWDAGVEIKLQAVAG